jgi:hypothetical protein
MNLLDEWVTGSFVIIMLNAGAIWNVEGCEHFERRISSLFQEFD